MIEDLGRLAGLSDSVLELETSRRGFLVIPLAVRLAREMHINPAQDLQRLAAIAMEMESTDDSEPVVMGSGPFNFAAELPADPGYFYTSGTRLRGLLEKFAVAYKAVPGQYVTEEYARLMRTIDDGHWSAAQGICRGRAAFQVAKLGPVQSGELNGIHFNEEDVAGLCSLLYEGDEHIRERKTDGTIFPYDVASAAFLDHMLREHLARRRGFAMDVSPDSETWNYPIDQAWGERRVTNNGTEVELTLSAPNFRESNHWDKGPRKNFKFSYRVNEVNPSDPGEFHPGSAHIKTIFYPAVDNPPIGFFGGAPNQYLMGPRGYQIRDRYFDTEMTNSLYELSGGIIHRICTKANPNCGF